MGALGAKSLVGEAAAQTRQWKHGLSLFGEPRYPAGFKHFDYVNPAAPKGGTVRQVAFGTFDNFNQVVAGLKGSLAMGTELFTEALTSPALDEVSTEYGLLAEAVSYPHRRCKGRLTCPRRRPSVLRPSACFTPGEGRRLRLSVPQHPEGRAFSR